MSRSRKNKGRNKKKQSGHKSKQHAAYAPQFHQNQQTRIGGRYNGILEINEKGYGFIRKLNFEFSYHPRDPFLRPDEVKFHDLRTGLILEGEFEEDQSGKIGRASCRGR